jgi:hypothetical protein
VDPSKLKAPPATGGNAQPVMHPNPIVQAVPTVNPAKLTAPTASKQATPTVHIKPNATPGAVPHNATPNANPMAVPGKVPTATPHAVPNATPNKTPHNAVPNATPNAPPGIVPNATPNPVPNATPSKTPHNAVPNAKPNAVPGVVPTATPQGQSSIPTKVNTPTNTATPGFFDRMKNYFRGDQKKIIEPGIQNKEVEAYRTDDAKEVKYKDTIIQDDKNVTLPHKHLK